MEIKSKQISEVATSLLQHHPKNMHVHSDEQIERLCELIKYQGWRNPIIVQKGTNLVVAGNGRLMAAKKLGIEKVPVIEQEFDSEAQLYAYMVSDNAIGKDTWATLDLAQINVDILDLGPELDISMLGLKDFVIEPAEKFEPQADEDEVPSVEHPITRRGDIWLLGNHRLKCGDSTLIDDVEKLMNGEKADMVFTDPPYSLTGGGRTGNFVNSGFMSPDKFKDKSTKNLFEVPEFSAWLPMFPVILKETSEIFVMSNVRNLKELMEEIEKTKAKIHNILIMNKNTSFPHIWYSTNSEFVLYYYYGNAIDPIKKCQSNVFDVKMPRGKEKKHASQKPVEFISDIISNHKGSLIFEPFAGSGSTLIACEKTNRKCYGMELEPKYVDVVIKRFEQYSGKKATLELTGQTYEELKAERDLTQPQKQN
jgi:DNA modification methylase